MTHLFILTGASRGMGLAMARQLVQPGHRLLCLSRQTSPDLDGLAQARHSALDQWQQDLADPLAARDRLLAWLAQLNAAEHGSATLINNAGVIPGMGPLDTLQPEQVAHALRVGLESPMLLTAAFLQATRKWVEQGWVGPRKVLNISSGLGRRAMAGQAPYCAAKAGMDHFSRCTALDEAQRPQGARIVSLAPGVIDTDMQTQLRGGDPALFPDVGRFVGLQTSGALSSPDDAAQAVLSYLAKPDFGTDTVADVRG